MDAFPRLQCSHRTCQPMRLEITSTILYTMDAHPSKLNDPLLILFVRPEQVLPLLPLLLHPSPDSNTRTRQHFVHNRASICPTVYRHSISGLAALSWAAAGLDL
jgi:hypothetical protein